MLNRTGRRQTLSRTSGLTRFVAVATTVALSVGLTMGLASGRARAQVPSPPFGAVQYGTNGCIEVGVRDTQPKAFFVPAGHDVTSGYPEFGYDTAGFTQTSGTNACRYNFRDKDPRLDPSSVIIGSAYCVQWAAGQLSGTGYDPEPESGTVRNAGYVRRILRDYWPATNLPVVPSTNPTVINRQRSGTVAMAIHYFTDGVVMPPNYQDPALYEVVRKIVNDVLAAGPLPPPADPTPTIDGPNGGDSGQLIGPFTIGANATGDVTVTVTGAEAFTDAAGTQPFTSGSSLPPGGQLWLSSTAPGTAAIKAVGPVLADIGTLMVGDPSKKVQSMMLAEPITLNGKSDKQVSIAPGEPPRISSEVSAGLRPHEHDHRVRQLRARADRARVASGVQVVPGKAKEGVGLVWPSTDDNAAGHRLGTAQ